MQTEARSTRAATTAARHAGRAAELAWPPSSHADIEKGYVAVEKEIQKHPHQGSLGGRERTKREGESRQQVEKEVEKECAAIEKEIRKKH